MGIPAVAVTIRDGGLGIIPANAGRAQVKFGACTKGTANTVYAIGSVQAAVDQLGAGPLVDAVVQALQVAGSPIYAVPMNVATVGTVTGAFTQVGSGAGTVTGAKGPDRVIAVKIAAGGTLGVATFQVSVDGSAYGAVQTTAATYKVPGTLSTLAFAAGTYVLNDVYTLNLDGTVTRTGSGTATLLDNSTHNPVDSYDIKVEIMGSGALGAGVFRYTLDGGNSYSGEITVPAGGRYAIPGTGVVLIFASTFVKGDVYSGTSSAGAYGTTEVAAGMTPLLANPVEWGFVHIVGTPANAAAAASLAAALDTHMTTAEAGFRYAFAIIECPTSEGDSTVAAAFASFASRRVMVCAGDVGLVSPLTNRTNRRNCAWAASARLGAIKLSKDPAKVGDQDGFGGPLRNVTSIYRDEAATPALDAARFTTVRTHLGQPGYFVTNGRMMASPGSDFTYVMNRRVMDRACTVARAAYLLYLNADVRVDKNTGKIDPRDANEIDQIVTSKLTAALLDDDEVSGVSAAVNRDQNILQTSVLSADVRIVPKAYAKDITMSIGFTNPALQATA